MLIGYQSDRWEKIATRQKQARKVLSQESAALVPRRLSQLAAFDTVTQVEITFIGNYHGKS